MIAQTHHNNLVRLLGFCEEGEHLLLIYEFMANGTLAGFLFVDIKPSWEQCTHFIFWVGEPLKDQSE